MEERKQSVERGNTWRNICQLVRIHLIQQKNLLIGAGGGIFLYIMFVTVCEIVEHYASGNVKYFEVISGYGWILWIGVLCILIPAYQLFTNEAVSMYPGNAVTRFWGRIIADHIRLFIYLLCVGLAYIVQCGLFWLCLQGKTGITVQGIFDARYLGAGLLQIGVICMALYGVFALFLALDARFGNWFSICLLLLFLVMGYCLLRYCFSEYSPKMIVSIWGWARKWTVENLDLFSYLGIFLLVWLVGILAAGILARYIRYWRTSQRTEDIIITVIASFVIVIVSLASSLTVSEAEYDEEDAGVQYASGDLYCSTLIKLPKNNTFTMDEDMVSIVDRNSGKKLGDLYDYVNNDNNIGYSIAGVSEAADLGIPEGVDLSGVDEEHAVLVYQLPNVRINGQEIYRDLMKDIPKYLRQVENPSKLEFEYGGRLQSTICVDGFPSVDRFLYHGDHDMTMAEYYNRAPFLQTTLLLSDTRYEGYERAMDE